MADWTKISRPIDDGTIVSMQAPLIISASRSTDIPAFYADWFFYRLKKGYSAWTNPFNGVKSYISYDKVRFVVFWSKNPRPLLQHLHILKERNIKCYVQYTLNDYEDEKLEKVPSLANRIETFKLLVEQLGKGCVIWRFDPMILTDDISIDDLLRKVQNIGDQLKDYTEKLVFSYADIAIYKKVKHNLEANGIPYHEWNIVQMEEFADKLSAMNRDREWNFQIATCGEKIDIRKYGIMFTYFRRLFMEEVKIGRVYRHFKGNYYFVENIAYDSEIRKILVNGSSVSVWHPRISVSIIPALIFVNTAMPIRLSGLHWRIGKVIKIINLQIL